jgi:hypothetical protein
MALASLASGARALDLRGFFAPPPVFVMPAAMSSIVASLARCDGARLRTARRTVDRSRSVRREARRASRPTIEALRGAV